ncbi:MAG TPA: RHS repeat-associated core domain-containing protein [Candidatus Acidoferrales bacterium]|nr:RHS repeat-associated core domain-containing protein [Candidatus Acidoferrales bacterium]
MNISVTTANQMDGYSYDAEGRRVRRTVPGSGITDDYLYDLDGNYITQVSGTGWWIRGELYADGRHLGTYENDLSTPTTFFNHTDHLGTERVETAVNGTACETITSLPFGDGLNTSGSCDPSAKYFTGKERDWESNLDNFGKRYYGSSMGRFMTTDPVLITTERLMNPQQLNLYAYVANNPFRFIDPTGEILQCVGDAESQKQCFSDLQQIAGDAANRLSMDAKTGVVSFDTKDLDLSKNEGAALVNDLVGSKNTYDFSVGPTVMTNKGPVRIDKISFDLANLPAFGDQRQIGNPPSGVSDILGLNLDNPNMTRVSNTNLKVAPEWTVAFHELAEAYEKIDGGKGGSYAAGHDAALQRELELRDQRPYLKEYNTGAGGPANSRNAQGGIIIKQ